MTTLDLQAVEDVDSAGLRSVFGCFPSGVTAICALRDDDPDGMAASAFTPVSLDPPLVSICVQKTSTTWPRLQTCDRLGVSVLAAEQDAACLTLSRKTGDRFHQVPWTATPTGAVFITGATAWLECAIHDEIEAGDHLIILLRILGLRSNPAIPPLIFHGSRFRSLVAHVEMNEPL